MRIVTHQANAELIRRIQQLDRQQAGWQAQIASGQRIAQPEDDAAAAGRVLRLQSEQRRLGQYTRNVDRVLALSQATYAGLQAVKKVSDRATEIGTLASGAMDAKSRQAYAAELDQLLERGLEVANSTFGGNYLFAGTAVEAAPFAATRDAARRLTGVDYVGSEERPQIPISDAGTVAIGADSTTNAGLENWLGRLAALRDALTADDAPAIAAAQSGLLAADDRLVDSLAAQGAVQLRVEAAQLEHQDRIAQLESQISGETDVDLATAMVQLNQAQVAYQAALQSAANVMRISLLDYLK